MVPTGDLRLEHAALGALKVVLDLVMAGVDVETIRVAISVHHKAFLEAYRWGVKNIVSASLVNL